MDPNQESDRENMSAPTYAVAPRVETNSERRRVLLGHIVATLSTNDLIKDEDMELLGHKPHGRTLMVRDLNAAVGTVLDAAPLPF